MAVKPTETVVQKLFDKVEEVTRINGEPTAVKFLKSELVEMRGGSRFTATFEKQLSQQMGPRAVIEPAGITVFPGPHIPVVSSSEADEIIKDDND